MTDPITEPDGMLKQWRDIAPRPGFEDRVRRRIAEAQPVRGMALWLPWIIGPTGQPAYAVATLVLSVALGWSLAWAGLRPGPLRELSDVTVMRQGSVAGSYARLTKDLDRL